MEREFQVLCFLGLLVAICIFQRRRRRLSNDAYGTAHWMSDSMFRAWGMLGNRGIVIGRTLSGLLLRVPDFTHGLLVGGTGSGKGVGYMIPNLLSAYCDSVVVFDTKGDLLATTGKRRAAKGEQIINLAPFNGGTDRLNPLDTIPSNSPMLVDSARALAEALVCRTGTESEPYWNDRAAQVITALIVFVLLQAENRDRNLTSVQRIASNREYLAGAARRLSEMRGLYGRLGDQLQMLFETGVQFTKEGNGVITTVLRHLSFLDSELVAGAVADSTFDVGLLYLPGKSLYLRIPPDQLEAQRNLLRCWVTTIVRAICASGSENSRVLALLDEASALSGLPAVEEALVRGRSAGIRMLLVYQSDSQVRAAFRDKPTLIYDNCDTQITLNVNSYEAADKLSKTLGSFTNAVDSYGENSSASYTVSSTERSSQRGHGSSVNWSLHERPLMRPDELLRMGDDFFVATHRGLPAPILGRKIRWWADPDLNPSVRTRRSERRWFGPWVKLNTRAKVCFTIAALLAPLLLVVKYRRDQELMRYGGYPRRQEWQMTPPEQKKSPDRSGGQRKPSRTGGPN